MSPANPLPEGKRRRAALSPLARGYWRHFHRIRKAIPWKSRASPGSWRQNAPPSSSRCAIRCRSRSLMSRCAYARMASQSLRKSLRPAKPASKWRPWSPSPWLRSLCTTCLRLLTRASKFARSFWSARAGARAENTGDTIVAPNKFMADNVKLLLVDDNPMVLGMLQQALSPLAHVTTATDAADALLKAVDDAPDLLLCDYRMPGMDGRQLVEKLKSRPATANFSTLLMASKADIAERLSPQDAADDYLEKPFYLKDAIRRVKRMIDRIALEKMAKTAPSDGVVRGSLSQMNVIDLMQSLEMGRKSCRLSLSNEGDKCEVFFVEGQVKHATYGSLVGDEAVFKVLRWTGGSFQLDFEGKTDKETTQLNTQGLLMEGLRLLDESSRDGGAESEPAAAPAQTMQDPFASAPPASASSAQTPSAPAVSSPPSAPAHKHRREEEEDVLLDG